jgi:CBS domain-containing protein
MPPSIREVMTADPVTLPATTTLSAAAPLDERRSHRCVFVTDGNDLRGVVTDRDIVARAVAEGLDMTSTTLSEVCRDGFVRLAPTDTVEDAVGLMSERAIRRLPVVENGRAVGIVAIGGLAIERDSQSALADISAAAPNI